MYSGCVKGISDDVPDDNIYILISGILTADCNSYIVYRLSQVDRLEQRQAVIILGGIECQPQQSTHWYMWLIGLFDTLAGLHRPRALLSGTCTMASLLLAMCGSRITATTFMQISMHLDTTAVHGYRVLYDDDPGSLHMKALFKVEVDGLKKYTNLLYKLLVQRGADTGVLKTLCNDSHRLLTATECLRLKYIDGTIDRACEIPSLLRQEARERKVSRSKRGRADSRTPTSSRSHGDRSPVVHY